MIRDGVASAANEGYIHNGPKIKKVLQLKYATNAYSKSFGLSWAYSLLSINNDFTTHIIHCTIFLFFWFTVDGKMAPLLAVAE